MNVEKTLRFIFVGTVSVLLLNACGMFRTHTDYEKSAESRPLELPPDLDTPSTAGELVVPPAGSGAAKASVRATGNGSAATGPAASSADASVHVVDTVANTWQRTGLALDRSKVGSVVSSDEAAHSYAVDVSVATGAKPGFLGRLIGHKQTVTVSRVNVQVLGDGDGANISVDGDAVASKKVMDALRERLS